MLSLAANLGILRIVLVFLNTKQPLIGNTGAGRGTWGTQNLLRLLQYFEWRQVATERYLVFFLITHAEALLISTLRVNSALVTRTEKSGQLDLARISKRSNFCCDVTDVDPPACHRASGLLPASRQPAVFSDLSQAIVGASACNAAPQCASDSLCWAKCSQG